MALEVSTRDAGFSIFSRLLRLPDKLWHLLTTAREPHKSYRLDFQQFSIAVLVLAQVQAQAGVQERAQAQSNQGPSL